MPTLGSMECVDSIPRGLGVINGLNGSEPVPTHGNMLNLSAYTLAGVLHVTRKALNV